MAASGTKKQKRTSKGGGKFLPALCGFLGTLILTAVILSALPLTIPRMMGYEIFSVVSGSMEPTLPVDSLVYVEPADPAEILPGEIVAFWRDGVVGTHRTVENRREENSLITRGDANDMEDMEPVSYLNVIGRVKYHVPGLGILMLYYVSAEGKMRLICIALAGALLNLIGSSLLRWRREKEREQT